MKKTVFTLVWMIIFCAVGFVIYGQSTSTNDDIASAPAFKNFIQNYIAAINSKDRVKFIELVHPKSVQLLAADKTFSDNFFTNTFSDTIPSKYNLTVEPIPTDKPLPYPDAFSFPVRPTLEFDIEYGTEPSDPVADSITSAAICKDGRWELVIPKVDEKKLDNEPISVTVKITSSTSTNEASMRLNIQSNDTNTPVEQQYSMVAPSSTTQAQIDQIRKEFGVVVEVRGHTIVVGTPGLATKEEMSQIADALHRAFGNDFTNYTIAHIVD